MPTAAIGGEGDVSGRIRQTFPQSQPDWISDVQAPKGAPNVLVWMIDDLGFAQLSSFGGLVQTPNIDRVAAAGLRYSNYHSNAICAASRAAFLTGRNSHSVHMGAHPVMATGFPGYDARVPAEAGTIAENLRQSGYVTYALGKWDHMLDEHQTAAGPFTYWPSGQGFDRFYGFLTADASNYTPALWSDHQPVQVPDDPDYHLTEDMADRAVEWIHSRDAGAEPRPFFMYWATGAMHAPHQAPQAFIDRYHGKFDLGWDKAREQILARQKSLGLVPSDTVLPPRPEGMPAWDSLTKDQQHMYARMMEVFAAQLTHADAEFGRILAALEARGELANTLIMITSDNGASAEGAVEGTYSEHLFSNRRFPTTEENLKFYDIWGGRGTYPHYPIGWAVAGNTPFKYYKQTTYEGGIRVPLVISWPKGILASGEVRAQYHHVTDLVPTILDTAKIRAAKTVNGVRQLPFDGISMKYTYTAGEGSSQKRVQYYETLGNRAIWADGWKAVIPHRMQPWNILAEPPVSEKGWELYHTAVDPTEQNNLADSEPKRLRSLVARFNHEARRNHVFPITNPGEAFRAVEKRRIEAVDHRGGEWKFAAPVSRIAGASVPPVLSNSFKAKVRIGKGQANGVLFAMGHDMGGMSFYLIDGRPIFVFRDVDLTTTRIQGQFPLHERQDLVLDFQRLEKGAHVRLLVDGTEIAEGHIKGSIPRRFSPNETFDVGSDTAGAVSSDYSAPFPIEGGTIDLVFQTIPD